MAGSGRETAAQGADQGYVESEGAAFQVGDDATLQKHRVLGQQHRLIGRQAAIVAQARDAVRVLVRGQGGA